MRTQKARLGMPASAVLRGFLVAAFAAGLAGQAFGQTSLVMSSDEAAGYLVFPKVIVQDSGGSGGIGVDTLIQITNTAVPGTVEPVIVHCWYINANSHCGGDPDGLVCQSNAECFGSRCLPGWRPANFEFELTPENPVGWSARTGRRLPGDDLNPDTAAMGSVRPIPEVPFRGELKCLQVDTPDGPPSARNDLKGEATIISVQAPPNAGTPPRMTAATYNAIGFQANPDFATPSSELDDPLCLGDSPPPGAAAGVTCAMQYAPCPNVLILNHFFELASSPLGGFVQTELTLVPCSEDVSASFDNFLLDGPPTVTAQMLVYNEFEQRFSTSARVQCYRSTTLSDIDTRLGGADDAFSIFAAGVQGTLVGQTRIRGVRGPATGSGYGLIGVAMESYSAAIGAPVDAMDAFNIHADIGFREEFDAVYGVNGFMTPSP